MQCTKILKSAEKLFAYKGFKATSMREIAEESGITKATIYHYFKSKEEILFTIMNEAMDRAYSNLEDINLSRMDSKEKFREILKFYIKYYAGNRDGLILLVNEQDFLTDEHKKILINKQRNYVKFIYTLLENLKTEKVIKNIPFSVITFAFFGMVHYTIKWYKKSGNIDVDLLADYFIEILLKGIEVK
jgi:AcrR family transcriptional regulator